MLKYLNSLVISLCLFASIQGGAIADSVNSVNVAHPSISSPYADARVVTMSSNAGIRIDVNTAFAAARVFQVAQALGYDGVTVFTGAASQEPSSDVVFDSLFLNEFANNNADQVWNIGLKEGQDFANVTFGDGTSGLIYDEDIAEIAAIAIMTGKSVTKRSICTYVWSQAANQVQYQCGVVVRLKLN